MKSNFLFILVFLCLHCSTKIKAQECDISVGVIFPAVNLGFFVDDCAIIPTEYSSTPVHLIISFDRDLPVADIQIEESAIGTQNFTFYNVKKEEPINVGPFHIYNNSTLIFEIFEANLNCGNTFYVASPSITSSAQWLGFIEAEVLPCNEEGEYFVNMYCQGNIDKFEATIDGLSLGEYINPDGYNYEPVKVGPINANNTKGETEIIIRGTENGSSNCDEHRVKKINIGVLDSDSPLESSIRNIKCDYNYCDNVDDVLGGFYIQFHNFNPSETGYSLSINGKEPVNYKYAETGHSNLIYLGDLKAQDFYFTITDLENPDCTASYFYENKCIDPYECYLNFKTRKVRQTNASFYIEVALSEESENVIMFDVYVEDEYKFTKVKTDKAFVLGPFDKEAHNQVKLKFQANMKDDCFYETTINAIDKPRDFPAFSGKINGNQTTSIYQNNHELIIESKEPIHSIALYDLNGKIISLQKGGDDFFDSEMFAIPKNAISGIYIVRIVLEDEVVTRKILLK